MTFTPVMEQLAPPAKEPQMFRDFCTCLVFLRPGYLLWVGYFPQWEPMFLKLFFDNSLLIQLKITTN
jgi:hypothetical protein